jgi:type II secretory pathway pseudopilin PulG
MQQKQLAGFFLEIFVVVAILGTLAAVAIPHVVQMVSKADTVSHQSEFQNIQTAVVEMLYDSVTGILEPVGPTTDMNEVRTSDDPPLVLTDYLSGPETGSLSSGCYYVFTADGTVMQILP